MSTSAMAGLEQSRGGDESSGIIGAGTASMRIDDLKQFVDKTVTLRMNDGEIAKVNVNFVDEEYEDIIAAVEQSSCPDNYRAGCAVYTFAAADIASVEFSE